MQEQARGRCRCQHLLRRTPVRYALYQPRHHSNFTFHVRLLPSLGQWHRSPLNRWTGPTFSSPFLLFSAFLSSPRSTRRSGRVHGGLPIFPPSLDTSPRPLHHPKGTSTLGWGCSRPHHLLRRPSSPLGHTRTYTYAYGRPPCVRPPPQLARGPSVPSASPQKDRMDSGPFGPWAVLGGRAGAGALRLRGVYERVNLEGRARWSRRDALRCAATSAKTARKRWPSGWIPSVSSTTCSRIESCKKSSDSWCVEERNPRRDSEAKTKHRKKHVREKEAKSTRKHEQRKRVERIDTMHLRGTAAPANGMRSTLPYLLHRPSLPPGNQPRRRQRNTRSGASSTSGKLLLTTSWTAVPTARETASWSECKQTAEGCSGSGQENCSQLQNQHFTFQRQVRILVKPNRHCSDQTMLTSCLTLCAR